MKVLAIDPSGNYGREGMGTTGWCLMEDGEIMELGEIKASDFKDELRYWMEHDKLIIDSEPDHVVIEGYKLYNHKGKEAKLQSNSELQTPQLIGILKYCCFIEGITYTIQFASEVKTRWNEELLARQGYLDKKANRYYFDGKPTSQHKRDAMKHALHYWRYKRK